MSLYITMLILSRPQTIWGRSPDNQVELSEWATACFKHCCIVLKILEITRKCSFWTLCTAFTCLGSIELNLTQSCENSCWNIKYIVSNLEDTCRVIMLIHVMYIVRNFPPPLSSCSACYTSLGSLMTSPSMWTWLATCWGWARRQTCCTAKVFPWPRKTSWASKLTSM